MQSTRDNSDFNPKSLEIFTSIAAKQQEIAMFITGWGELHKAFTMLDWILAGKDASTWVKLIYHYEQHRDVMDYLHFCGMSHDGQDQFAVLDSHANLQVMPEGVFEEQYGSDSANIGLAIAFGYGADKKSVKSFYCADQVLIHDTALGAWELKTALGGSEVLPSSTLPTQPLTIAHLPEGERLHHPALLHQRFYRPNQAVKQYLAEAEQGNNRSVYVFDHDVNIYSPVSMVDQLSPLLKGCEGECDVIVPQAHLPKHESVQAIEKMFPTKLFLEELKLTGPTSIGVYDLSYHDAPAINSPDEQKIRVIFTDQESARFLFSHVCTAYLTTGAEYFYELLSRVKVDESAQVCTAVNLDEYQIDPGRLDWTPIQALMIQQSVRDQVQMAQTNSLVPVQQIESVWVLNQTYYELSKLLIHPELSIELPAPHSDSPQVMALRSGDLDVIDLDAIDRYRYLDHAADQMTVDTFKYVLKNTRLLPHKLERLRVVSRAACLKGNYQLSRWGLREIKQLLFVDLSADQLQDPTFIKLKSKAIKGFHYDVPDYIHDHETAALLYEMLPDDSFTKPTHGFHYDGDSYLREFIKGEHLDLVLKTLRDRKVVPSDQAAVEAYWKVCETGVQEYAEVTLRWHKDVTYVTRYSGCLPLDKSLTNGRRPENWLNCMSSQYLSKEHVVVCGSQLLLQPKHEQKSNLRGLPIERSGASFHFSAGSSNHTAQTEKLATGVFSLFGSVASGISAASQSLALPNTGSAGVAAAVVQNSFENDLVLNTGRALLMTGVEQLVQEICERLDRASNEAYGYKFLARSLVALAWSQACKTWFSGAGLTLVDCIGIVMMPVLLEFACLVFNKFTAVSTSERISNSFKDFAQDFLNYFHISYPNARNVAGTVMKMYMANILFAGASFVAGKTGAVTGLVVAGAMFGAAAAGGYVGHELAVGAGITTKLGSKV